MAKGIKIRRGKEYVKYGINKIFIFNTNIGINNSKNLIAKDSNIC